MSNMRKIVKDMVDTLAEEELKKVFETIEIIMEKDRDEAWSVWADLGENAIEGKWADASEKHDFYLYGING